MTSSIVQPYIDQENANAVSTNHRGRLGSLAGRQAKTFGSSSTPLATPRRALGEVSNDPTKRGLGSNNFGKKSLNGGDGKLVFKKSLPSQVGPIFKKPSITTPGLQGLTFKKKPLRLKSEGTTKKSTTAKMSEMVPNAFEDVFPDIENMHIFDEEREPTAPRIPDSDCLSRLLDRVGPMRAPLIHHTKKDDVEPDFSHIQLEPNSRRRGLSSSDLSSSSVFDLPVSIEPVSLQSCLLNLPPLESVDFMDLNNIPDFFD